MEEKIELTQQEIEDIKDTAKFRSCVILKLKELKNIPKKVTVLETKVLVYGALTIILIVGVLTLAFRVMAGGG